MEALMSGSFGGRRCRDTRPKVIGFFFFPVRLGLRVHREAGGDAGEASHLRPHGSPARQVPLRLCAESVRGKHHPTFQSYLDGWIWVAEHRLCVFGGRAQGRHPCRRSPGPMQHKAPDLPSFHLLISQERPAVFVSALPPGLRSTHAMQRCVCQLGAPLCDAFA